MLKLIVFAVLFSQLVPLLITGLVQAFDSNAEQMGRPTAAERDSVRGIAPSRVRGPVRKPPQLMPVRVLAAEEKQVIFSFEDSLRLADESADGVAKDECQTQGQLEEASFDHRDESASKSAATS